jgi:hypothetical protein
MSLLLKHYGFQRYPSGALSYWLLPCNADTTDNRPILFIHGIGMGRCSMGMMLSFGSSYVITHLPAMFRLYL